jgi:CRP/FNR family transcriptional regulator, transcriptional activator FtrB
VLLEGAVELTARGGDDREAVIEIFWPVDCFILAAALTATPYLMTARTLEPSRLLMIGAERLRQRIREDLLLALALTASLAGHFRMMVRQIKDLKLRNGTQRLGCFLLRLVDEAGAGGVAELPCAKGTLASRLGMTSESLSRALVALRAHGLEVRGSRIVIADRDELERYCRPDALIDRIERDLTIDQDQPREEQK